RNDGGLHSGHPIGFHRFALTLDPKQPSKSSNSLSGRISYGLFPLPNSRTQRRYPFLSSKTYKFGHQDFWAFYLHEITKTRNNERKKSMFSHILPGCTVMITIKK
ncbi:MAG: hypothetical protein ACO36E_07755, partial [Synechocystis sp.]